MLNKQDVENIIKLLQTSNLKGGEVMIYLSLIQKLEAMYSEFDKIEEVVEDDTI